MNTGDPMGDFRPIARVEHMRLHDCAVERRLCYVGSERNSIVSSRDPFGSAVNVEVDRAGDVTCHRESLQTVPQKSIAVSANTSAMVSISLILMYAPSGPDSSNPPAGP